MRSQLNDHWGRVWGLIADKGEGFAPHPLPAEYEFGKPDHCIGNALSLARQEPELVYVEGVAYLPRSLREIEHPASARPVPGGLFRHAWCVNAERQVLDTTYGFIGPLSVYLGLPIKSGLMPTPTSLYPTPTALTPASVYLDMLDMD
jgi:hypothetical protein